MKIIITLPKEIEEEYKDYYESTIARLFKADPKIWVMMAEEIEVVR